MPSKRFSRKLGGGRGRRRDRRTNVFVAPEKSGAAEVEDDSALEQTADDSSAEVVADGSSATPGRSQTAVQARRARARARQSRGSVRSEVFTRTLPTELRKLGMLTGGIAVALIVLTVVLG